jgi:hypothetical protein
MNNQIKKDSFIVNKENNKVNNKDIKKPYNDYNNNDLSNSFLNYNSSTKDKFEKSFNYNNKEIENYPPYLKYHNQYQESKTNNNNNINKNNSNINISINSFNYETKDNFICNLSPQERDILTNEEDMSLIPRNYSESYKYLLFSDENININIDINNNINY